MKYNLVILDVLIAIQTNCNKSDLKHPESKILSHKVNDIATAQEKSKTLSGLEADAIFSEHKNKKYELRIILGTAYPKWNDIDTATWIANTKKTIENLVPYAISNEAGMYELLTEKFPEQIIHLWQMQLQVVKSGIWLTTNQSQNVDRVNKN